MSKINKKIKMTYFGNCQLVSIKEFLKTNKEFDNNYEFIDVKLVHTMTDTDLDYFFNILPSIRVLLIQPINDNYKNNHKYSTTHVLKNVHPECTTILLPNLYFSGYLPFDGHLLYSGNFILE